MIRPLLVTFTGHLWVGQLMDDVLKIVCEAVAKEPLHVLKDERLWGNLTNSPDCMREHVSLVVHSRMFTTN